MAISQRIRDTNISDKCEFHKGYVIDLSGKHCRIYELNQSYSSTSGQILLKGKVIRRYDWEAKELEGKIAKFNSIQEAIDYIDKWL